jgi:hypothetical protein
MQEHVRYIAKVQGHAEHGIFAPWPFVLGVPHALWVERTLYKVARDGRLLDDALGPRRHSRVGWAKRKRKRARRRVTERPRKRLAL